MPRPPFVPGLEVAGTVRELGPGVTGFAVGERVVSMSAGGTGGYAYRCVTMCCAVAPGRWRLDQRIRGLG